MIIDTKDYSVYVQNPNDPGSFKDIIFDTDDVIYIDNIDVYSKSVPVRKCLGFRFCANGITYVVEGKDQKSWLMGYATSMKKRLKNPQKYDPDLYDFYNELNNS